MSYIIKRADGSNLLVLSDNTVSTKYSVTFVGKMVPNYGTAINTNFLRLLENSASSVAPATPVRGELWYDTSTNQLKYFNGNFWHTIDSFPPNTTGTTAFLTSDGAGAYSWTTINSLSSSASDTIINLGNISGPTTLNRAQGNIFKATAIGNFTISVANCNVGQSFTLIVTQDATGSRTATYPGSFYFAMGFSTLSTAPRSIDMINVFYDGTKYYATLTIEYVVPSAVAAPVITTTTTRAPTITTTTTTTTAGPPMPTYAFGAVPSAINEGSSGIFNVNTTNVSNGTTLYWSYSGGSADPASDFVAYNGSFTINNNTGSFTVSPIADMTTDTAETFSVNIRSGSPTGLVLATSGTVTINDTSTTLTYSTNGDTTSALLYGAHTTGGGAVGITLNGTTNGYLDAGTWISNGTTKIAEISSGGLVNVWFPLIPTMYGDVGGTLYQHQYSLGTGDLTPVVSPNSVFCWRAPQSNWTNSDIQGMLGFNSIQLSNVRYATRVWWNYFLSGMDNATACGFAILKADQYAIGKQTCWNNRVNYYLVQVVDVGGEWQEQGFTFEPTVSGTTLSNVGSGSFAHIGATGRGVFSVMGVNGETDGSNLRSDYTWTLGPNDLVIPIMRSDTGFSGGARNGPRNPAVARFGMIGPA
jgi:hypothetical protein